MSEDNLGGILQTTEEYLARGQSATITLANINIPDVPVGTKVSISLTAERDTRNKRSAQGMLNLEFKIVVVIAFINAYLQSLA